VRPVSLNGGDVAPVSIHAMPNSLILREALGMNWCMLLAMASVAGPWSQNSCRTYYWSEPMPVYVTSQEVSNCGTYTPAMVCGQEVAQVCEESKSVAANASAKEEEKSTVAASATETDPAADEESVAEFVNYSAPASYGGGDLALDWGVASIGAGTLYPNAQNLSGGGAFPFMRGWGNGSNGSSGGSSASVTPSPIIIYNIINNTTTGGGGGNGGHPVPEPASIAAWSIGVLAVGFLVHRRRVATKTR